MLLYGVEPECIRMLLVLAEDRDSCLSGGGDEERSDPFHDLCCRVRTAGMEGLLGEVVP